MPHHTAWRNGKLVIRAIFKKYDIPVFIDSKKDLNQNILVKFVLSVLDIFAQNWSYEAVFSYIKTGLIDIDIDAVYYLENYCLKWGIKGSKWYKGEWNFYDESEEEIQKINYARKMIIEPLLKFKNEARTLFVLLPHFGLLYHSSSMDMLKWNFCNNHFATL